MSKIVGRIYPNGEFGVGFLKEVSYGDLGLSNDSKSHTDLEFRASRGENGITSYGATMVRNAAFLLEKRYRKERMSFATLTLPALSRKDWIAVVDNWSSLLRVFLQRLKRQLRSRGVGGNIVGCVEIQPKRWRQGSVGVPLHIHFVFEGRKQYGSWVITPAELRLWWFEALSLHAKGLRFTECVAVENIQRVEKSVECYLAKYLSKGFGDMREFREMALGVRLPSAWWFCSAPLKDAIKRNVRYGEDVGQKLSKLIREREDWFEWHKECWMSTGELEEQPVFLGYCGKLSKKYFHRQYMGLEPDGVYEWNEDGEDVTKD